MGGGGGVQQHKSRLAKLNEMRWMSGTEAECGEQEKTYVM